MTATPKQEKLAALFRQAIVIPVLTIERLEHAVPLARALVAGGVRVLEVTLRTAVAVDAAKAIVAEVPDAVVGIGTILNGDDLARAKALGAVGGSWLCPAADIRSGNWAGITAMCDRAMKSLKPASI